MMRVCEKVARANFNEDPYVKDFGISIETKMVSVSGRILPPPLLQYGGRVCVIVLLNHVWVGVGVSVGSGGDG